MPTAAWPWRSVLGHRVIQKSPGCQLRSCYSLSLLLIKPPRNGWRERKYLKYLPINFLHWHQMFILQGRAQRTWVFEHDLSFLIRPVENRWKRVMTQIGVVSVWAAHQTFTCDLQTPVSSAISSSLIGREGALKWGMCDSVSCWCKSRLP